MPKPMPKPMPKLIRIVLADDHTLVRAGVRSLLEDMSGVQVVGEANNGLDAIAQVAAHQPDILLVDIAMPGLNGLEAAARIAKESPDVRIIILSMHSSEEYVMQAFRAGVAGYLLKDSAAVELGLALDAVAHGATYLSPAISRSVIDGYLSRVSGSDRKSADPLTPRQREILKLIADGQSTKEMALTLGVSIKTIETHRAQVMERLGIHDVAGLVKYAMRTGLIPRAG
jgi:DNA-binding NarL/FixJ family response regulator